MTPEEKWQHQPRAAQQVFDTLDMLKKAELKPRAVLQMPTAAGKTRTASVMFLEMIEKFKGVQGARMLFVCDQINLVEQTYKAFMKLGLDCGIIQGSTRRNLSAPIQVASIQTLPNRSEVFEASGIHFPFQIYDECHCLYETADELMGDNMVVGLTATPQVKGIGDIYTDIVVGATYQELLDRDVIVGLTGWEPEAEFDERVLVMSRSGKDKGEVTTKSASESFKKQIARDVIPFWIEKQMDKKKTLVFVPTIDDAVLLASDFNQQGFKAYAYHSRDVHNEGKVAKDSRDKDSLRSFDTWPKGDGIQVMVTVDRFIKGVDVPSVECGILARPVRTEHRLWQMLGRLMRYFEGKEIGYVLDMCSCIGKVGWPIEMDAREPVLLKRKSKQEKTDPEAKQRYRYTVTDWLSNKTSVIARELDEVNLKCTDNLKNEIDYSGDAKGIKQWCTDYAFQFERAKYFDPKNCADCGAISQSQDRVCSHCGFCHERPPERTYVHGDVPMKAMDMPDLKLTLHHKQMEFRKDVYQRLKGFGEARGFKGGYAAAVYKERFGEWPPRGWSSLPSKGLNKDVKAYLAQKAKEYRKQQRASA